MKKKEKNNITLKIISLFLAIFLWIYVMDEVNPEIEKHFNTDLIFSNVESLDRESLTIKDPKEAKVIVTVSGKKSDMDNFSPSSIKALVDLSGYTEGQKKVPVQVSLEHQMNSIKIIDHEPKEVLITFDKILSEEKAIKLRTVGELAEGYVLSDVSSKSETVLLKGPRTWLNEVREVVGFIQMDGRKNSDSISIPLRVLDGQGNDVIGIEKSPKSIDVDIEILRSKEVDINLKTDGDLPDGYEIKQTIVNPKKIKLKGDERVLALRSVDTKEVSMTDLIEKGEMEVELDLPEGIEKLDAEESVKVKLELAEIGERIVSYKLEDLEIKNLSDELEVEMEEIDSIDIKLEGEKSVIDKLTKDDILPYLDLEGIELGEYSKAIDFETGINDSWRVKEILPESIKLIIKNKNL